MALTTLILLGIILLVLIGILLTCSNFFIDVQKRFDSIYGQLYDSKQLLRLLEDRIIKFTEYIESIHQIASCIEKHEISEATKTLERIEVSLMELKDLHDTLSSLERLVGIIVDHPAFTTHDDDNLL